MKRAPSAKRKGPEESGPVVQSREAALDVPAFFRSDVPPGMSEEWREAANSTLKMNSVARAHVHRILNDPRMSTLWDSFDALIVAQDYLRPMERERIRRKLLLLMATKGGRRSLETTGQITKRRQHIAEALRAAIEAMEADGAVQGISVAEALHWAFPGAPMRHGQRLRLYLEEDGSFQTAPYFVYDIVDDEWCMPLLVTLLGSVAKRLEVGAAISFMDPLREAGRSVQPGRSLRAHFEHALVRHFGWLAHPLPTEVFAPVIEVALELPSGSIDAHKLRGRLAKISR